LCIKDFGEAPILILTFGQPAGASRDRALGTE
jgi:hypothetical protein